MAAQVQHWRFTVDDYHRMAEAGILSEDDCVELIDGEVVHMSPIGGRHVGCVNQLTWLLSQQLGDDLRLSVQNPIRIDEFSEPEPDLAVIRARQYGSELPSAADVLLLIEVADTSLEFDHRVKLPLYARAGIAEVWLVDLPAETVERHTEPSHNGYRQTTRIHRGDKISSTSLPTIELDVDAILG